MHIMWIVEIDMYQNNSKKISKFLTNISNLDLSTNKNVDGTIFQK